MVSARVLFAALALTTFAGSALAQTPPSNGSSGTSRPFGTRPNSDHGGPFSGSGSGGPYTPGTTPGGGGAGPFTPGVDGPAGPNSPNNNMPGDDRAGGNGPFSNKKPGFWSRLGKGIWDGIKGVGTFIYTLGGYAPWANQGATGTVSGAPGGFGNNAGRYDNTIFNNEPPSTGNETGTVAENGSGNTFDPNRGVSSSGNASTDGGTRRRSGTVFLNP